jgi:hypothetical protein
LGPAAFYAVELGAEGAKGSPAVFKNKFMKYDVHQAGVYFNLMKEGIYYDASPQQKEKDRK